MGGKLGGWGPLVGRTCHAGHAGIGDTPEIAMSSRHAGVQLRQGRDTRHTRTRPMKSGKACTERAPAGRRVSLFVVARHATGSVPPRPSRE